VPEKEPPQAILQSAEQRGPPGVGQRSLGVWDRGLKSTVSSCVNEQRMGIKFGNML